MLQLELQLQQERARLLKAVENYAAEMRGRLFAENALNIVRRLVEACDENDPDAARQCVVDVYRATRNTE